MAAVTDNRDAAFPVRITALAPRRVFSRLILRACYHRHFVVFSWFGVPDGTRITAPDTRRLSVFVAGTERAARAGSPPLPPVLARTWPVLP